MTNDSWSKSSNNPLTADGYGDMDVFYQDGTYHVYAQDRDVGEIDHYTGTTFDMITNQGAALSPNSGENDLNDPSVIQMPDGSYYMYFAVDSTSIHYATADNLGGPWTRQSEVLSPSLSWEYSAEFNEPSVIRDDNDDSSRRYKMLYTTHDNGSNSNRKQGYAYSSDGISWSKYTPSAVVSSSNSPLAGGVEDADLIELNGIYYIYLNDYGQSDAPICKMWSTDCINWHDPGGNPVLQSGGTGTYDAQKTYAPSIIYDGSKWVMYYQAIDGSGVNTVSVASGTVGDSDLTSLSPTLKRYDGASWVSATLQDYGGAWATNPASVRLGNQWVKFQSAASSGPTVFESWESGTVFGDLGDWSGAGSDLAANTNSPVTDGSYSLKVSNSSGAYHVSTGASGYPGPDEPFAVDMYVGGTQTGQFTFFNQDAGNAYQISLGDTGDTNPHLEIQKLVNGSQEPDISDQAVSTSLGQMFTVEVEYVSTTNTITADLRNSSGTNVGSVSGSDSTYTSGGGVGIRALGADTAFDNFRVL